jgi:hypothetical protein
MKGMVLLVAGLGVLFLVSADQPLGMNWLGQVCRDPARCFHMEWLAAGIALLAAAYIAWRQY